VKCSSAGGRRGFRGKGIELEDGRSSREAREFLKQGWMYNSVEFTQWSPWCNGCCQ